MVDLHKTDKETAGKRPFVWKPFLRRFDRLKVFLFALLLLVVFFLGLMFPLRPSVSELEKRKLTEFPEFRWETFLSGEFFKEVETWYADTFPFREQLLALNRSVTALYGINDVQFIGDKVQSDEIPDLPEEDPDFVSPSSPSSEGSSALSDPSSSSSSASSESKDESSVPSEESEPSSNEESSDDGPTALPERVNSVYLLGDTAFGLYGFSQSGSSNYASVINSAADKLEGKAEVYSAIVPLSYGINLDEATQKKLGLPSMKDAIRFMYSKMNDNVHTVSAYGNLEAHSDEYLFFRTDHHWTALGAYRTYEVFCNAKGIAPHPLSYYETVEFDGFLGTMYSACNSPSAMKKNPDTIVAYKPKGATTLTVTTPKGKEFSWPIIKDVSTWDANLKYNCFAASDQAFETIHNKNITDDSAVLIVKDSYGNAFIPFLVDHYEYVYVVDPRHYTGGLVSTVKKYGIDDVLFLHNVSTTGSSSLSGYVKSFVNR